LCCVHILCIYVYMYTCVYTWRYTHTHTNRHTHMHTHTHAHTHTCTHTHMHTHTHAHTLIHINTHPHTSIHIHTHAHTQTYLILTEQYLHVRNNEYTGSTFRGPNTTHGARPSITLPSDHLFPPTTSAQTHVTSSPYHLILCFLLFGPREQFLISGRQSDKKKKTYHSTPEWKRENMPSSIIFNIANIAYKRA